MKTPNRTLALLTVSAVVLLSACTTGTLTKAENTYLTEVHTLSNTPKSETQLLEAGYKICTGFDLGLTGNEVVETLNTESNYGTDPALVSTVISAALANLCPQHLERIK